MPALQILTGARVNDLQGVDNFQNVRNLMALYGGFRSLEPLRLLRNLTHLDIQESRLQSLETVSRIHALRQFEFRSDLAGLSLEPLKTLPALHQVQLWLPETCIPAIAELKEELTSWDMEFLSRRARHTPSLEQMQNAEGIGLTEADNNPELLSPEMNWLRGKLDEMVVRDLGEIGRNCDHDYGWHGSPPARLLAAGMGDEDLLASLPRLVSGIQQVLCHGANDWTIELLSEAGEREDFFSTRIYPDNVLVSEEHAVRVNRLISPG